MIPSVNPFMIPLNVFERIKITFICQSFTLRREVTDLPVWHHCCTSNSFFNIRSKRLGEISTSTSVSGVLSLKKTLFFFCPALPSLFLWGTQDKNHQCGWRKCRGCEETDYSRETKMSGGMTWWIERQGGRTDTKQVHRRPLIISLLLRFNFLVSGQRM